MNTATVGILSEFKKPISLGIGVLILLFVVVIIRYMRRDKRAAKKQVKAMEAELEFQNQKDKTVYTKAAETYNITAESARICDQIAMAINGAFGGGMLGNDNEDTIILQLNRLAGPKTIKCADFFYKKYSRKSNPNIAYDSIATLNRLEWGKVKDSLKENLLAHARIKGEPHFDIYF